MFYSQLIDLPSIGNKCAKCEKVFEIWSEYHMHVTTVTCVAPRQPMVVGAKRNLVGVKVPLSNERHSEIIRNWENKNKGALIQ